MQIATLKSRPERQETFRFLTCFPGFSQFKVAERRTHLTQAATRVDVVRLVTKPDVRMTTVLGVCNITNMR